MQDENQVEGTSKAQFEQVYRGMLRALYEGRYVPGQRLSAPDLMREFGVGRGTIREILQRLASTGAVTIKAHRSAQVRRLSRKEVSGILDVVEVLLGLAARGVAGVIGDRDVRAELNRRYEAICSVSAEADFQQFLSAREDYYRFIVAASGNPELQRVFPNIQVQLMRVQLRSFGRAADSTELSEYSDLNAAILSADAERAEAAGRAHVKQTMSRVFALPDRAFEPDGEGR